MKDEDGLPTTAATKKESMDSSLFGKGRYKFWALAAILLLAFWSMFTGTVSLRWSGTLNSLSSDIDTPIHDDLDVLEMEEREKVVRHMWDVYTNSRRVRLPRFWQEAFEAAYEDLTSDVTEVRDAAVTEIAKMSVRSIHFDPPPLQSTVDEAFVEGRVARSNSNVIIPMHRFWPDAFIVYHFRVPENLARALSKPRKEKMQQPKGVLKG
ncbi:hypothetical protein JHK87_002094 [Glycine soja]|nr:hypothetical protein JHK87_002094 [Glycine soja]